MTGKVTCGGLLLFVLAAAPFFGGCTQMSRSTTLAAGGASDYTIVVDPDCSPAVTYGAEELQTFMEQICGARLPISAPPVAGPMILVGPSAALDALRVDIDFDALGDEGLVMKTVGPHLVLAGGGKRGTLYAVYEFLDRYMDCRWYSSGGQTPAASRIPWRETVVIPRIDERKIPALEYRSVWYAEAFDGDWAARNRLNGHNTRVGEQRGGNIRYHITQAQHTFNKLVSSGNLGEHPEYFALNDGVRKPTQLCLANPDVLRISTETVQSWLREDPDAQIVAVVANDGGGFCGCELCGPLTEYEGSRGGVVLHFTNQIADNIRAEFPYAFVETLAYSPTVPPARHARPRDNVIVRFATAQACRAHPLSTDCGDHWYIPQFLAGWSEVCGDSRLYVWDYVVDFANLMMPYPNLHVLQPNVKFFVDNGVKGVFSQANPAGGGEFAELRAYLLARSYWDPDTDWRKEMSGFLKAYYGAAGKPIGQYIEMLWEKAHRGFKPKAAQETDLLCPVSGRTMFKHFGTLGPFLACDKHPKCKGVLPMNGETERVVMPQRPPLQTEVECPVCAEPLDLRRSTQYGPWLICSTFPSCLGRIGWSTLEESRRAQLEQALGEHEQSNPLLEIRNQAGEVFDADHLPPTIINASGWAGRDNSNNSAVRVYMYDQPSAAYLTAEIVNRADELFDQAEAAVADEPLVLLRVRKERLAIEYVKISRQAEFLPTWQEYEQAVDEFVRIAKAWSIENSSEGKSLDGKIAQWREHAKKLKEAAGQPDG